MFRSFPACFVTACTLFLFYCSLQASEVDEDAGLQTLGASLFHDTNLSRNRQQACASCHNPAFAFVDKRHNGVDAAVSLGDDGISLGDRNAPTLGYAHLTPRFSLNSDGVYLGGLFHDGRADTMMIQAKEPIINPIEMALRDETEVHQRVLENPSYVRALKTIFGDEVIESPGKTYAAVAESLAKFEESRKFSPFDSRYDRYLRGEYEMTREEDLGRKIFFSDLINCRSCHLVNQSPRYSRETFTNYQYHNIGVPRNNIVRASNGKGESFTDPGLLASPRIADITQRGKFKVPSLRNIAVTGPYMHNGVFRELKTVLQFYNKYLVDNALSRINPETGKAWLSPEVDENLSLELLENGQPLDVIFIGALEAFLKTLTDKQYEHLVYREGSQ